MDYFPETYGVSADETPAEGATCPPALPSGTSAYKLMKGDIKALPTATLHWLGRSSLIGIGLYVGGLRGKVLVKNALLGGAAIELFVLAWAGTQRERANA